ncbi:MAG: HAMP domain-containing histidine kinase [Planctomycetes bacterium]|nr:HAMP domain-containing histidine kinase [Planctomycetota bacterium]
MASPARLGAPLRERGVLLLGCVSAAVLVVAAFLPANDPETVARTALAQLAARTEQAVVDEWQRALRADAPLAPASSDAFQHDPAARVAALAAPPPRAPEELASDRDDVAGGVLLDEARRLDAQGASAEEIESLLSDALAKALSRPQRVAARVLRLQRARERDDRASAERELRALVPDFDPPDPRLVDLGPRVLLAAGPLANDAELVSALALPGLVHGSALLAEHPARIERLAAPRVWYRVADLEELSALVARLTALDLDAFSKERIRTLLPLAAMDALARFLPESQRTPGTTTWDLVAMGTDFFARRGAANGAWSGFFVTRDDLGAALVERMRAGELLPEGIELDFDGARDALGVALRPRVELQGAGFAFTLRHADPEALVRSETRRQSWLRGALFVMAAFAAGAGFVMARALRRERKLAELKTTFIANVSHELRTPLASILLMAENLESGRTRDAATTARYHGLIKREAQRLSRLVDDVLDFSRLERGKKLEVRREDVDVRAVVDDWCTEFRAWAAQHQLELALDVRDLPATAALDKDALRRALFNLLDNARKHSGSKRARFEALGERRAHAGGGHHAVLVLRVADEGVGIPPAKRASVFEPFERLREGHDAAPGTGLGLAIVKEIVLAHEGTIAVRDPEHGSGAVFELALPCDRGDEEDE